MGLCDDDQYVWRESAGAAMRALKTLRERVYWMAVFLIKNMPNNPKQIVEDNLQYLAPKAIEQPEQRMKYFLLRLEYILRFAFNYLLLQVFLPHLLLCIGAVVINHKMRKKHVAKELVCHGLIYHIFLTRIWSMYFFATFYDTYVLTFYPYIWVFTGCFFPI